MEVDMNYTMSAAAQSAAQQPSSSSDGQSVKTADRPSAGDNSSASISASAQKRKANADGNRLEELNESFKLDRNLTRGFLESTIEQANKVLFSSNTQLNYSVHEKTGHFLVKIVDRDTNEVIKEIPPEKTLDAVARMWELAGILVDERG